MHNLYLFIATCWCLWRGGRWPPRHTRIHTQALFLFLILSLSSSSSSYFFQVQLVDCYESLTHQRRQEGLISRTSRAIELESSEKDGGEVMMESTRYTDPDTVHTDRIELQRQAKMFKTSSILSSLLQDYDSRLRPQFGGPPVEVDITLHVDSLGPISETEMSFRVDFAFRQYWLDKRLEFARDSNESITLSHEFLEKIWLPDTYFPESLSANKHKVMVPNILLRLSPDGGILYSCRVTVVAKCPMNLKYFPLDTQNCKLIIEAYGYTVEDLRLQWKKNEEEPDSKDYVAVTDDIDLSQFQFINFETDSYELAFSTGNFSDLEVKFIFKRTLLYFVLQSYVPATLIVNLSWVSFWVDPRSIPARASLAITTVLTMITLMGTVNSQLPKVSNVKALDVYFGMCFFYVFAALIEFSAVCYLDKGRQKSKRRREEAEKAAKEYREAEQNRLQVLKEVDGLARPATATGVSNQMGSSTPAGGGAVWAPTASSHYSEHVNNLSSQPLLQQHSVNSYNESNNHSNMGGASFGAGSSGFLPRSLNRSVTFGSANNKSNNPSPSKHHPLQSGFQQQSNFNKAASRPPPPPPLPEPTCCSRFDVLLIDNYSRVIFPTTFLILNLLYWGAYSNIMTQVTK